MEHGIVISVLKLQEERYGVFHFGSKSVCSSVIVIMHTEIMSFPGGQLPYDVTH